MIGRSDCYPFDLGEADLIASAIAELLVRIEAWFAIAAGSYSEDRAPVAFDGGLGFDYYLSQRSRLSRGRKAGGSKK